MSVPRQRKTKSRRNQRRMHFVATPPNLVNCKKCGKPVIPHTICLNCGYYKGKEIIDVLKKLTKKERKKREKEIKTKEEEKKEKPLTMAELSKK
jgi:large subunit ribosomal protein L32